MAKDDFIRIKYTREVDGRKKRSSVSVDPDLFEIFAKIRGTVPAARAVLREQPRALRFRVILQQQQCGGLDAVGLGQCGHALCVAAV